MKRIILVASLAILLLAGCEFLSNLRARIQDQAKNTATSVVNKASEVGDQIQKTKQAVEQKVQDVKNAVNKVGEAVDAVKKVTGDSETTGSSASAQ